MKYVRLGKSDLQISRIAFGCEPLGGVDWGEIDEGLLTQSVFRALDLGVTLFDTADVYGLGRSEETLAKILGSRIRQLVIATKGGVNWEQRGPGQRARTFHDSSPSHLARAVEDSLRRLGIEAIPLYQVHWPDPSVPFRDTMDCLLNLRRQGKILHLGVCNFPAELVEEFGAELDSVQCLYNILEQETLTALSPPAARHRLTTLAYGTLSHGLLTGRYDERSTFPPTDRRSKLPKFKGEGLAKAMAAVEVLREVSGRLGSSLSKVALRWVLDTNVSAAIVGMMTPTQVLENISALELSLSPGDVETLRRAAS